MDNLLVVERDDGLEASFGCQVQHINWNFLPYLRTGEMARRV